MSISSELHSNYEPRMSIESQRKVAALETIARHLEEANHLTEKLTVQQLILHKEVSNWQNEWLAWNKEIQEKSDDRREREIEAVKAHTDMVSGLESFQRQMWIDNLSEVRQRVELLGSKKKRRKKKDKRKK